VAKYCDEHVCVCLCVRQDIPGTTRAIFTNFAVRVAYRRGSAFLRQVYEIPRIGAVLGVFSPVYSPCTRSCTRRPRPSTQPWTARTRAVHGRGRINPRPRPTPRPRPRW